MDVIKPRWRSLKQALIVTCVAGSFLFGTGSWAAAPDPGRAAELYKEAKALYESGDTEGSLEKLKEAYEVYPADKLLLSIANRHLELGEPEDAQETLSRITPETAQMRTQVQRLRKQITSDLKTPVAVRITTDVEGATVSVDGGPDRALPLRVQLPRGKHRFLFTSADGLKREVMKTLRGMTEMAIMESLTKPVARWRLGLEPVASLRDVRVSIDGVDVELSDDERSKPVTRPRTVEPGLHTVICLRGLDERAEVEFEAVVGEVGVVSCAFGGASAFGDGDRRTWAWLSAGGAVAAIASSLVLYMSYKQDQSKYASERYVIKSSKPEAAIGLGVSGAALGGLSTWLFLTD